MGVGGGGPGTCNAHPYIYIEIYIHTHTRVLWLGCKPPATWTMPSSWRSSQLIERVFQADFFKHFQHGRAASPSICFRWFFYGFCVIHHEWHHHLGNVCFFPTTFSKSKFQKVFFFWSGDLLQFARSWLRCRRYGRWKQWKACYFANSHAVLFYIYIVSTYTMYVRYHTYIDVMYEYITCTP